MRQSNTLIYTGSAFTAVWQTLTVFLVMLGVMLYIFPTSIGNSLTAELRRQVIEESQLLSDIYFNQGLEALKNALQQVHSAERLADAVNSNGLSLTKALPADFQIHAIEHFEVRELPINILDDSTASPARKKFLLTTVLLHDMTLVVGRSTDIVNIAKRRLIIDMLLASAVFIVISLVIGYYLSRHSAKKLQTFEGTLAKIAEGDLTARLPIASPPEQIDWIAENMNVQLTRIERLVESMNNTTRAIAHDLKTPLSRAQISLHNALDACETQQNPVGFIQQALDENIRLNNLFETILRISRLQFQTPSTEAFPTFELYPVLVDIVDFLAPEASTKQQKLTLDCNQKLQAKGDKSMLQQALINLINNAILYSGNKTCIRVRANMEENQLTLSVCDTGVGIAEKDFKHVLTAFTRLEASRNSEGNGLGLAMVQAVADYHGGSLVLSANRPSGLCVTLNIPLSANFKFL